MDTTASHTELRQLADFEGAWTVNREIVQADGPPGTFTGQAVWSPDPRGLLYRETGVFRLGDNAAMRAERAYLWDRELNVHFPDGRFFHSVRAQGGEARHWCDPDTYVVTYDFSHWPAFDTVWTVTGPRKDYRMHSRYARAEC